MNRESESILAYELVEEQGTSRMLKQSASSVLASFRPSTYPEGTPRALTRCGLAGRAVWASCESV